MVHKVERTHIDRKYTTESLDLKKPQFRYSTPCLLKVILVIFFSLRTSCVLYKIP